MGLLRLLKRNQIGIIDTTFSLILQPTYHLFNSIHSSLNPGVATGICSAKEFQKTCEIGFIRTPVRSSQLGFRRTLHGSVKNEFYVQVAEQSSNFVGKDVVEKAENVCKMLANVPGSDVGCYLNQSKVEVSPELVVEVLKTLANSGALAMSFFRWAETRDGFKHTTECYHCLIEALGRIKQFRLIWSLVDTMRSRGLLTKDTFAIIYRRYVRAKMVKNAIEAFENMGRYGLVANLSDFNRLVDAISKSKNVDVAQKFVYHMKKRRKFSPDLKTYTILMEGWGNLFNISKLTDVYQEMMAEGLKPDHVTYGILINSFCKSRKLEEALEIFREMEARNIKPSAHIYCNLINGLGADKRLDDALKFFEKFNSSGFPPELPTFNAVVGAYCWSQQFNSAYTVVDEMKRFGLEPNSRTFDVILNHLIRAKKNQEAYHLYERMRGESGCKPELNTYTMIVRMFCAEGRVDMATQVWKQMKESGVLPCLHMFMVLINRLCYENKMEDACAYLEEMLDQGIKPPGQLRSNVMQALQDGGRKDWMVKLGNRLDKLKNTPLGV